MAHSLTHNDWILGLSLAYSCMDLVSEWDNFATCHQPIHKWMLVSYSLVVLFRVLHVLGARASAAAARANGVADDEEANLAGEVFLLDLRPKSTLAGVLISLNWFVCVPAFVLWTILGVRWQYQVQQHTPLCMPTTMHQMFSIGWLFLCCVSVVVHLGLGMASWTLEKRVRRAEGDLRQLADSDAVARWGNVSELSGFQALSSKQDIAGLRPMEIQALGGACTLDGAACTEEECSICLNDLRPGESLRCLPNCQHTFHRSCIDLWLLRSAACPLCKQDARAARS